MLNAALKIFHEQSAKPAPKLRLVPMPDPTVTFLGDVYAITPEKGRLAHPQNLHLKQLWRVTGLSITENGVYAINFDDEGYNETVFLSKAEKNKGNLEERDTKEYGLAELSLEPHPIRRDSELWKLFVRDYQKAAPNTTCEFV